MFYCDSCARGHGWPESIGKSRGLCEMCDREAVCNDVPSKYLPVPVDTSEAEAIASIETSVQSLIERRRPS